MSETILWILLFLATVNAVLLSWFLFRLSTRSHDSEGLLREELRASRGEANQAARESRDEIAKSLRDANDTLSSMLTSIGEVQRTQLDGMTKQVKDLTESSHRSLEHMRDGLESRVRELQGSNEQKLEQMRNTLDEKISGHQAEVSNVLRQTNETMTTSLVQMGESQTSQVQGMTRQLKDLSESNQNSLDLIRTSIDSRIKELQEGNERRFEDIRKTIDEKLLENRSELATGLTTANETLAGLLKGMSEIQSVQLDGVTKQLKDLANSNQASLDGVRTTLDSRVKELQESNDKKLEEMRKTVDEKLHETLERRLGESFKLVSDKLEAVQRGLGEMQNLATGVGDLQRVLSNVKIRGTWTEVQLGALLEQILAPGQYQKNVCVREDSRESVEYAIRLPGQNREPGSCLWLPIDAKFPQEDYRRVQEAAERGDPVAVRKATEELARAIKAGAQKIHDKYINPPVTTDFAIMFLATEGLYGEALRQPALVEELQRRYRIVIAGPTTLAAILNSLRMGFQTLAIEHRASEVLKLLGAIKTEFGQFSEVLERVKKQLNTATRTIESTGIRTRAIERKLRGVEQLPEVEASAVLGLAEMIDSETEDVLPLDDVDEVESTALTINESEESESYGLGDSEDHQETHIEGVDPDDIPF